MSLRYKINQPKTVLIFHQAKMGLAMVAIIT